MNEISAYRIPSAAIKTIVFSVLVPGTVGGVVPRFLASAYPDVARQDLGTLVWAGWLGLGLGAVGYLWCALDFVRKGLGTPAPVDPPVRLVVGGLYRFSRNPMYMSVLVLIFGQGLMEGSGVVLGYGVGVWLVFFAFVRWFEEPRLLARFGPAYERYLEDVPRWIGFRRRR